MHLGQDSLIRSLLTKLNHHLDIICQAIETIPALDQLFQNRSFFQYFLRTGRVVPETGGCNTGVKLLQLLTFAIKVKGTSGGRKYECSGHQAMLFLHDTWGLLRW